jgi:hypothetical protein
MRRGQFDDIIDQILELAQWRSKIVSNRITETLRPGDKVSFKSRCRPECLAHALGEVIKIKRDVLVIELLDQYGEFKKYDRVDVPATLVELI